MPTKQLSQLCKQRKKLIKALCYLVDRAEEEITSSASCESIIQIRDAVYQVVWIDSDSNVDFAGRSKFYIVLAATENLDTIPRFHGINSKCKGSALRRFQGQSTYCQFRNASLREVLAFANHLTEIIQELDDIERRGIESLTSAVKSLECFIPKPWTEEYVNYPDPFKQ